MVGWWGEDGKEELILLRLSLCQAKYKYDINFSSLPLKQSPLRSSYYDCYPFTNDALRL